MSAIASTTSRVAATPESLQIMYGPAGELANFPQAFTHVALVNSAFNLSRIERGGRDIISRADV